MPHGSILCLTIPKGLKSMYQLCCSPRHWVFLRFFAKNNVYRSMNTPPYTLGSLKSNNFWKFAAVGIKGTIDKKVNLTYTCQHPKETCGVFKIHWCRGWVSKRICGWSFKWYNHNVKMHFRDILKNIFCVLWLDGRDMEEKGHGVHCNIDK